MGEIYVDTLYAMGKDGIGEMFIISEILPQSYINYGTLYRDNPGKIREWDAHYNSREQHGHDRLEEYILYTTIFSEEE